MGGRLDGAGDINPFRSSRFAEDRPMRPEFTYVSEEPASYADQDREQG